MTEQNRTDVRRQAEDELHRELFREAVEAEKARLRASGAIRKTITQRIADLLPIKITITRKSK